MRKYQFPFYSDSKLLMWLRERDDMAAFEELFHRCWRSMLDTAFQRLKSKKAAQEVVQDIMSEPFY